MHRLKTKVFTDESTTEAMSRVHVLDLCNDGYVKSHVDSIRVSILIYLSTCLIYMNKKVKKCYFQLVLW